MQVIDSVYNHTSFIYSPESFVSEFLKMAGGITVNADDEMYILKVNGMAISKRNLFSWLGGFNSKKLEPGHRTEEMEKVVG